VGESRIKLRGEDLAWRELDGEIIVVDLRSSRYLNVNSAGAALWPRLAQGATHDELVSTLVETFAIPSDQAQKDVTAFVEMCVERDLLGDGNAPD
jgi:hypothetical protein